MPDAGLRGLTASDEAHNPRSDDQEDKMPLKTVEIDGATYAEVRDGKPVYIDGDSKEHLYDAEAMRGTLTRLQSDLDGTKKSKGALEEQMKAFEGLNVDEAREAMDKLSKIDAKKLVDAGDMDAAVQAAIKPYTEKLTTAEKRAAELEGSLSKEMVGNQFARSKFATEKLSPAGVDLIRTLYGDNFKIEDGKVVGYDANGQKIYSKSNPGEVAGVDEVLETLVDSYPHKDHILKGVNANGSGAQPGSGGNSSSKTISRDEFNGLSQSDRQAKMKDGFKIADAG